MRLVGFALVFAVSVFVGKYFSDKENRKIVICEELCGFLQYLCQAVSKNLKIDDIIRNYCSENKSIITGATTKSELSEMLRYEMEHGNSGELLQKTLSFLDSVGKAGDAGEERANCIEMLDMAKKISEAVSEESRKRKELYRKLGVIFGVTACIVLM